MKSNALAYLIILRWPNLLILAVVQLVIQWGVVVPALSEQAKEPNLWFLPLSLLVLANALVAAAGYVINDVYDMEIDALNKPERRIIPNQISEQAAWRYFIVLMTAGILASIATGVIIRSWLIPVLITAAGLSLWWYSWQLKREPLIGNLAVSAFCGGAVFLLLAAEPNAPISMTGPSFAAILMAYVFFAFFSTLYREMIKDLEDMEGDSTEGAQTLPIAVGEKNAKLVTTTVALILILGLIWWIDALAPGVTSVGFIFPVLLLVVPLLMTIYLLWAAHKSTDFGRISNMIKLIMLAGIMYVLLI